jgi:hypothetical protein
VKFANRLGLRLQILILRELGHLFKSDHTYDTQLIFAFGRNGENVSVNPFAENQKKFKRNGAPYSHFSDPELTGEISNKQQKKLYWTQSSIRVYKVY